MNNISSMTLGIFLLSLAGCSELQVKRDLKHAQDAEQYIGALKGDAAGVVASDCRITKLGAWNEFSFSATSPVVRLPNGLTATAFCFTKPAGAKILQIRTYAAGGMTFHELTIVHPSILALDNEFKVVRDLQKPKLSPGEHFIKGLGLTGNLVLGGELARTGYAAFYIHPESLEGAIDVQTGFESIPIPYGPYGKVEIRFE